jgi:hypothetical protein
MVSGTVFFILYKGDHYHITVLTENEHIFVDTNDIWDDGDRVGKHYPNQFRLKTNKSLKRVEESFIIFGLRRNWSIPCLSFLCAGSERLCFIF